MEVRESNLRYIPLKFLKDRKIKYVLYLHFQINSSKHKEEQIRYFYKNSLAELSRQTCISLNTLRKAIKDLESEGIICSFSNNKGDGYFMPFLEDERYILLNFEDEVLKELVSGKLENELKIYIYLKNKEKYLKSKSLYNPDKGILLTQTILCDEIGISPKSRENIAKWVKNLKEYGILDYEIRYLGGIKKQYCYFLKK